MRAANTCSAVATTTLKLSPCTTDIERSEATIFVELSFVKTARNHVDTKTLLSIALAMKIYASEGFALDVKCGKHCSTLLSAVICKRRKSRSGQLRATPQMPLPRAHGVHLFHPTSQLSHRAASVRAHVAELHQRITPVGGQAVGGHCKAVSSEKWRKAVRTLCGTSVGQRAARSHGGAACAAKSLHDPCSRV